MLINIETVDKLRGLAIAKARKYETKTIHPKLVEEALNDGWEILRKNKYSTRIKRNKSHSMQLEDRVWCLLYRMGFTHLSMVGGAILAISPKNDVSPKTQIDVVGIDDLIAIAIECKSSEKVSKRPNFSDELGKHALLRENFMKAIKSQYPIEQHRVISLCMFFSNILLSENDEARAKDHMVTVFDSEDLTYYENLVAQIGPAAKYQFFSDILPGKRIGNLAIKVPAVKNKIGDTNFYTFSVSPDYLLKISYVSHRIKGKPSDINAYQRMLSKSRLNSIKQYISEGGKFPTNIVINLDKESLQFYPVKQEGDEEEGVLGWLDITPAYKSAWIIDGQHRLFAYSGHEKAKKDRLSVLAFEGLVPSEQAKLFIDINSKQKNVKPALLQELYAELNWDAKQPRVRIGAIISKAVQVLGTDKESPFYKRIQRAESSRDILSCISLTSLFSIIEKSDFYIAKERHGNVLEYGPLWAGNNEDTLKRTVYILKNWFQTIISNTKTEEWWNKGRAEGGGLAMNEGVIICVKVLRSVFQHLDSKGYKLIHRDNEEVIECIKDFAIILGDYLGTLTEDERKLFRSLRGIEGQTSGMRRCQKAMHDKIPLFNPPGLEKYLEEEKAQTNKKAKEIIDRIEKNLNNVVLDELRTEFGTEESEWWMLGVPKAIRKKVTDRFEDDDGKRGSKEYYIDLIHYREIVVNNWQLFEPILAFGKTGNKEKRTAWMVYINSIRNIVSHHAGKSVSLEELSQLQEYDEWLLAKMSGQQSNSNDEG